MPDWTPARPLRRPGRRRHRQRTGADGEDAIDGPVGQVPGGGCRDAGGIELAGLVLASQVQHAPQPMQGVAFQHQTISTPGRTRLLSCGTKPIDDALAVHSLLTSVPLRPAAVSDGLRRCHFRAEWVSRAGVSVQNGQHE